MKPVSFSPTSQNAPVLFHLRFAASIETIRNRQTKISRAVTRIDSLYRWALTGTPITNSLADLYPIFRFLQLKPWYDWTRYRAHGEFACR